VSAVRAEVTRVKHWRHAMLLPDGIITPGSQETVRDSFCFGLPKNLEGKRVLDVGCSDGFYAFECERRGAAYVMAIDDFSSVYVESPTGFHVAHRLLESKVEFRQCDVMNVNPQELGQFDLVLFLGVLYHLRHPLLALERLAELCRDQLIIETLVAPPMDTLADRFFASFMAALLAKRRRSFPFTFRGQYMEFYEGDDIGRDPTNWWAPSIECLKAMLRSCGFCGVTVIEDTGTVHAFSPRSGTDVEELLATDDPGTVSAAYQDVTGRLLQPPYVAEIQNLSIVEFGQLRQRTRVLKGKRWHQHDRWEKGNS
jgi:tRNA (mo5U34)-methyltransferase